MEWTCCKCEHKYEDGISGDAEERLCFSCLDGVKMLFEEKEYQFNFRGRYEGVEAVSLESAYGYFYSTYPQVSKAELDEAYCGEEE